MEDQIKNHRRLQLAVLALGVRGSAEDLSEAVNAFGQVIADLVDKPCRLAVIVSDELSIVEALQAANAKLTSELQLLRLNGMTMQ